MPRPRLLDHAGDRAAQTRPYGLNVVVRVAGAEPRATLDALLGLRPFAVLNFGVLPSADVAVLTRRGILVVPKSSGSSGAVASDPGIARLQGETLRRHGERPVWYAAAATERPEPFGEERLSALREFCAEEGLEPPRIVSVPMTVAGGREALERVRGLHDRAAIACYNDDVALALLAGARELQVGVPDEVALIGVDATMAGQLWSPRLTTVHVNMHGYIANLVAELREELEGGPSEPPEPLQNLFTLVPGETA
jgi:DNA-binding LacI/PurR family transcriptional regulator